jgi:hypothetical protein
MLSKDYFNSLSIDHKADLVFQKVNHRSNRTYYLSEVSLYTLDGLPATRVRYAKLSAWMSVHPFILVNTERLLVI